MVSGLIPVGTIIRFIKTLEEGPCEDHPGRTYAIEGDLGIITGHGTKEGYWVKWQRWPSAAFGANQEEFEVAWDQMPGDLFKDSGPV